MSTNPADDSLYSRATNIGASLSQAQNRVTTFFVQQPDTTAASSAVEIAALTDTSDATVIRTAYALGYSGMKELKRAALDLLRERVDPGKVLEHRIERVQGQSILGVIDDTLEAATRLRRTFSLEAWSEAVDILTRVRRVFCFGLEPVGFIGDYLAHMLNRVGCDARSSHNSGVMLADYLLPIGQDDALVVFAPIRQFDEITAAVHHAKSKGATVILITEAIGMPIRSKVDCTLTTYPTSMSSASDQVLPLTIAHGLFLEVAARKPERARAAMRLLNQLRPSVSAQNAQINIPSFGLRDVNAEETLPSDQEID